MIDLAGLGLHSGWCSERVNGCALWFIRHIAHFKRSSSALGAFRSTLDTIDLTIDPMSEIRRHFVAFGAMIVSFLRRLPHIIGYNRATCAHMQSEIILISVRVSFYYIFEPISLFATDIAATFIGKDWFFDYDGTEKFGLGESVGWSHLELLDLCWRGWRR